MNSNVGNFLQNVFRSVFFCSVSHTSPSAGQPNQKLKRSERRNRPPAAAEALESRTLLTTFSDLGALGMTGAFRGGGVWGDYDNDGDLDAVITGRTDAGDRVANIFRNDSGAFTDIAAGLANLANGSASWGDYDRDGDLDLFISGVNSSAVNQSKLYRNNSGTFVEVAAGFTGARYGSSSWGDFDNDGDLDLLLAGRSGSAASTAFTKIFRNDGGDTFTESSAALPGVAFGSVAAGDYDSDGDLDILISGTNTSAARQTGIYRNDGNETFTEISAGLAVLNNSSAAWGDYDNDGDLDLLFMGQAGSGQPESRIYRNDGSNIFTDIAAPLPNLFYGAVAWGDLDNDGDLDAFITGRTAVPTTQVTRVFVNNAGTFADDGSALAGFDLTSGGPGDYDNDGDLDLLISGRNTGNGSSAKVYRNDISAANTAPAAPGNLTAAASSPTSLTFSWSAPADTQTASAGLSYNLRVGTTPGGSDVYASMANASTGRSRIAARGPIQGTSYTLKGLTAGQTYYWSVQAVDPSFAGSAFATESSVGINAAPTAVSASPNPASIAENTSTSSRVKVADLSITDDGRGTNSLSLSGTDQASFEIVGTELFLRAGVTLNFEAKTSYSVTVNVDDASLGSNPDASTNFTLNVTNVNEAPTAVTLQNTTTSLAEDASTAAAIKLADISVTDDALGTNSLSLSGTDAAFFEIVSNELRLKSGTVLNFEAKTTYNVTVEVNDAAVGGAVDAFQNFTLTITDVNEAPTALTLQNTTTSLAEDTSTAAAIKLADILVIDDGLGTNVFSLSGTDAAFVEIVSNELRLKSGTVLNFEAKTTYAVTVEVNDATVGGAVDASQNFTLTITDVNEAPTAVTLQNTTTSLAEDASTASAIKLADISFTDDALGTNVFSLSGTDAAFFELSSSNELLLKAGTVLNFEAKSTYDVTVEVNDATVGGAIDASQSFTLTITDVNEAPTALTLQNTTTSLAEDASTAAAIKLADILVTDDVPGTNVLSLSGTDAAFFEIVSNELRLKSGTVLNFEAKTTYDVTVEVNDALVGGAVDASQNFTLTITDVNEAPTALALQNTTTSLAENTSTAAGIKLADISVTDDAMGTNVLSLSGTDAAFFEIVGNELRLKADTVLDFETKSSYDVTVEVDDATVGGAVDASQNFTLTILNVLDTTPDADAFILTFSPLEVTITHAINGGTAVQIGKFLLNAPIVLNGLAANDSVRIVGTSGSDTILVSSAGIVVNGMTVTLNGPATRTLAGGAGSDTYRFDADDVLGLYTLEESSSVSGGVDTVSFAPTTTTGIGFSLGSAAVQTVHPTNLSLRLTSTIAFENLFGGDGNDILSGNSLPNTILGNAGNDRINGAGGSDAMSGGNGDDLYVFTAATSAEADSVNEAIGGGTDTLSFETLSDGVSLFLSSGVVQPIHTNRTLLLRTRIFVENVIGGSGDDDLTGNESDNTIVGNAGNDRLHGLGGNDVHNGGTGNDTYVFSTATAAEADRVIEGTNAGIDTLTFSTITSDITLDLTLTSAQSVHLNRTLALNSRLNFENLLGGFGNDTLTGNSIANTIFGNAGNDAINGGDGSDSLYGGLGADSLTGGAGNDSMFGGGDSDVYNFGRATVLEADTVLEGENSGSDTLNFAGLTTSVIINLGSSDVQAIHTNRTLLLSSRVNFENVLGGSAGDQLIGNAASNILVGNGGNDQITGVDGRDILIGGLGLDTLNGGAEDDILIAGRTTQDAIVTNLLDLQTEWTSASDYATRTTNLRTGVGPNLASLKAADNVLNDLGDDDSLTGGSENDWYFQALDDVITDLLSGEAVDLL